MKRTTFIIPYPTTKAGKSAWSRQYGLNAYYSGKHWSERNRDAEYWHTLVSYEMSKQKVQQRLYECPVILTFHWCDNLDISNHAAMGKMIEDALKGKIIKDDSPKYVVGAEHYFHGEPYIRVTIREA